MVEPIDTGDGCIGVVVSACCIYFFAVVIKTATHLHVSAVRLLELFAFELEAHE